MNKLEGQPTANHVTCRCQHCDKGIEFDASRAGDLIVCPHCGLETKLFIPPTHIAPPTPPSPPSNPTPKLINDEIKKTVNPLGVAALVLGIISCVVCWFPFFGFFAYPIAFIGMILAGVGLVMSRINKKTDNLFPIGGGIVCLLSVIIPLSVNGAFESWKGLVNTMHRHEAQAREQQRAERERQWTFQQENITVSIYDIALGIQPGGSPTEHKFLLIMLHLSNSSSTRTYDYTTFRSNATLTDDRGNIYKVAGMNYTARNGHGDYLGEAITYWTPPPNGWTDTHSLGNHLYLNSTQKIQPDTRHEDMLGFEIPNSPGKILYLELSAQNFGGTGKIQFEIPVTRIVNW